MTENPENPVQPEAPTPPSAVPASEVKKSQEIVGVQFLKGGGIHYYLAAGQMYNLESICVVEGDHGLQVAKVVRTNRRRPDCQMALHLRPIIRIANSRDMEQLTKNDKKEQDAYRLCRQKVQEKGLQMKLVDVNYTLDGRKAVFYFTAENRVDFRELVKELAQVLKNKIEMRQIGVRDEARRLGGVGCCGRPLCCNSFLKDFSSVSIRMAKEQNLSLNPAKVSGLCGRLMCCLAYEYEGTGQKGKKPKTEEPGKAEPPAVLVKDSGEGQLGEAPVQENTSKAAASVPGKPFFGKDKRQFSERRGPQLSRHGASSQGASGAGTQSQQQSQRPGSAKPQQRQHFKKKNRREFFKPNPSA